MSIENAERLTKEPWYATPWRRKTGAVFALLLGSTGVYALLAGGNFGGWDWLLLAVYILWMLSLIRPYIMIDMLSEVPWKSLLQTEEGDARTAMKRVDLDRQKTQLLSQHSIARYDETRLSGFARVARSLGYGRPNLRPCSVLETFSPQQAVEDGYWPFIQIRDLVLMIKPESDNDLTYLLFENETLVNNLHEATQEEDERIRLLHFVYVKALEHDCEIDQHERHVLRALEKLLLILPNERKQVCYTIYRQALERISEDGVIDNHEGNFIRNLLQQMELNAVECSHISSEGAEDVYNAIIRKDHITESDADAFIDVLGLLKLRTTDWKNEIETIRLLAFLYVCVHDGIPVLEDCPLNLKSGEEPYFHATVSVKKVKTVRRASRNYVGTRVKLGELPIYFGRSMPDVKFESETQPLGKADFVITNKRVLVVGQEVSYSLHLDKILKNRAYSDGIQILYDGRNNGNYYLMNRNLTRKAALILDYLLE